MKLFLYFFSVILFSACGTIKPSSVEGEAHARSSSNPFSFINQIFDSKLTYDEYTEWVNSNLGVTMASEHSNLFDVQLLFYPPEYYAYQTCLYQDVDIQKNFNSIKNNQSEFLFAKLLVTNKNQSVNNTVRNDDLLKSFISDIKVFHGSDSLTSVIFETFNSPISSKPHEILIVISKGEMNGPFTILLKGKDYALKDLTLHITEDDFKDFPNIKL